MVASADANTRAGVIAFTNATSDYTVVPVPPPPDLDGWNAFGTDLVMMPVPYVPVQAPFQLHDH